MSMPSAYIQKSKGNDKKQNNSELKTFHYTLRSSRTELTAFVVFNPVLLKIRVINMRHLMYLNIPDNPLYGISLTFHLSCLSSIELNRKEQKRDCRPRMPMSSSIIWLL